MEFNCVSCIFQTYVFVWLATCSFSICRYPSFSARYFSWIFAWFGFNCSTSNWILNVRLLIHGKWHRMPLIDQQTLIEHKAALLLLFMLFSLSLTGYNESQSLNLSRSSHESLFLKSFHFRNKSLALLIAPKRIRIHYNALKKINHFLNDTDLSDSDRFSVRYGVCHIKSVLAVIKLLNSFIKILKSNIFHVFLTRVRSTL